MTEISNKLSYSFKYVEEKWQKYWQDNNIFKASINLNKPKYYILEMFPYPSGKIHMGHVRNYSLGDVIARYKRAKGFNVLHPMGWDAFGLPAENAAKENSKHPSVWTYQNIESMKKQIDKMGFALSWNSELVTCSPDYYKFEQEMFIEFFKQGLAYKKNSWVNWDPVENTVLANEQVVNGRGWRSNALVEQRQLSQWFLRITDFAEDLLTDLDSLKGWDNKVKTMQKNWIGKSVGATIYFPINLLSSNFAKDNPSHFVFKDSKPCLKMYSTSPHTLFGASFVAISIHHPLAEELAKTNVAIDEFIKKVSATGTVEETIAKAEKEGVVTDITLINPINNQEVPLYITNYVLDYGFGAIFGCPAHDARDYDFAKKYNLPVIQVINSVVSQNLPYEHKGNENDTIINSPEKSKKEGLLDLNGLSVNDAKAKVIRWLEVSSYGESTTTYRLKDWGVSRQRYWGCPIPIIYCEKCGVIPEKKENLPVSLPQDVDFSKPGNPLDNHPTWKYITCPNCGGSAKRETDTFDTFFESSWYFLRYTDSTAKEAFNPEALNYWMNVDQYIGGVEHAVMHLLYARFFTKALQSINMINLENTIPFNNLLTQGMICHKTYKTKDGKWLSPPEVTFFKGEAFYENPTTFTKEKVIVGRSEKMSKSKKNTVDPDVICDVYGADTARLFVLSDSPPDRDLEWADEGVDGIYSFLNRFWRFSIYLKDVNSNIDVNNFNSEDKNIYSLIQRTIFNGEKYLQDFHFNKTIAIYRELFNKLEDYKGSNISLIKHGIEVLIQIFNPFIPHICEELWNLIGHEQPLCTLNYPVYVEEFLHNDTIPLAVQILGKTRGVLDVSVNITENDILELIKTHPSIYKYIEGKEIKKVIYVKGRIINFIV